MVTESFHRRRRPTPRHGAFRVAAWLALALVPAAVAGPAAAQRLPAARFETAARLPPMAPQQTRSAAADTPLVSLKQRPASTGGLILGAVVGGALAGAAGAALGSAMASGGSSDGIGTVLGAAAGFVLLEPVGVGVGTHVADRGRGSVALDILAAAGALVVGALSRARTLAFAAIPAQIGVAVAVERATARRALPKRPGAPTAAPDTAPTAAADTAATARSSARPRAPARAWSRAAP